MGGKISKHGSYSLEKKPKKKKKGAKLEERASSFISLSQSQIYEDEIKTPLPQLAKSKSVEDVYKNGEFPTIPKISTVFNTTSSERDDYSSPDDERIYENILENDPSTEAFGSVHTSDFEEQMERKVSAHKTTNEVQEKKKRRTWSQSESHPEDYFDIKEKLSSISGSEKNEETIHHSDENWKDILNGGYWTGGIQAAQMDQARKTEEQIEVEVNCYEEEGKRQSEEQVLVKDVQVTNSKMQIVQKEEQVLLNSNNSNQMKNTQWAEDTKWSAPEDHSNQDLFSTTNHTEVNNLHISLNANMEEETENRYQQTKTTSTEQHLEVHHNFVKDSTDAEQLVVDEKNTAAPKQEQEIPPNFPEESNKGVTPDDEQLELLTATSNQTIKEHHTLENHTDNSVSKTQLTPHIEGLLQTNLKDHLQKVLQKEEDTDNNPDINSKSANDLEEQMEVSSTVIRHKTLSKSVSVNSDIYYEFSEDKMMIETDSEEQESFYDAMDFEDTQNEAQVEVVDEDDAVKSVKLEKESSEQINDAELADDNKPGNLKIKDKETKIKVEQQAEGENRQYDFIEVEQNGNILPPILQETTNKSSTSLEGLLIDFDKNQDQLDLLQVNNELQPDQNLAEELSSVKTSLAEAGTNPSLPDEEENVGVLIDLDDDQINIRNSPESDKQKSTLNQQNNQTTKAEDLNVCRNPEVILVNIDSVHKNVNTCTNQNLEQEVQDTQNSDQIKTLKAEDHTSSADNSNQTVTFTDFDKANEDKVIKEYQNNLTKREVSQNFEDTSNEPVLIDLNEDETNAQFFHTTSALSQNVLSVESTSESPQENIVSAQNDLKQSLTLVDSVSSNSNFSSSGNICELESIKNKSDLHVSSSEDKPNQSTINTPNNLPLPQTEQNKAAEKEEAKESPSCATPEDTTRGQMKIWEEQEEAEVEEAISQINTILVSIDEVKSRIGDLDLSEKAKDMQGEMYQILIKIMREVNTINNHDFNERVIELQHRALDDVHECLRQLQMKRFA